jgi:hypothetical protein
MEQVYRHLRYDEGFKVLICLSCQYCLTQSGVEKHFQRQYGCIPIDLRKELVRFSKGVVIAGPEDIQCF